MVGRRFFNSNPLKTRHMTLTQTPTHHPPPISLSLNSPTATMALHLYNCYM